MIDNVLRVIEGCQSEETKILRSDEVARWCLERRIDDAIEEINECIIRLEALARIPNSTDGSVNGREERNAPHVSERGGA